MATPVTEGAQFVRPENLFDHLTLEVIKLRHPDVTFEESVTVEFLEELGYTELLLGVVPEGDVVTDLEPFIGHDGKYVRQYAVRPFTAQELEAKLGVLKEALNLQLFNTRVKTLEKGAPINFGTFDTPNVQHVQLRDGDRANVLGLYTKASASVAMGSTAKMMIRTYENKNIEVTPAQMLEISWLVLQSYEEVMKKSWYYQDLINSAKTIGGLPELPDNFTPTVSDMTPEPTSEAPAEEPVEEPAP